MCGLGHGSNYLEKRMVSAGHGCGNWFHFFMLFELLK